MTVPHLPLLAPVKDSGNRSDVDFADGVATAFSARQEEDFFLDVRGEIEEVHDLSNAGAGDVAEAGDVGVVGYCAFSAKSVEPDGKRQET